MKILVILLTLFTMFSLNTFAQDVPVTRLRGHRGYVNSVVFSPNGQTLASASGGGINYNFWGVDDYTIRLWDVETGAHLRTLEGHTSVVNSVAFSPDGTLLASSGSDQHTIRLWSVATGTEIGIITGHTSVVNSVAFSPNGQTLASGSRDNTIRLWDVATFTEPHILKGHNDGVNSVAFSPNGQTLASGSRDNTIRLWDVATGTELHTLKGHNNDVNSVAFSPDGTLLASGSDHHTIRLWSVATGTELRILTGHTFSVNSVAFSPNGQTLASGGRYNTAVHLWDVKTGTLNATLIGHTDGIYSVVFSPDGKILASGSRDQTIRLWVIPDTRVSITTLPVDAPAIGDQLTLNINITAGEKITGYQAKVRFDPTALRFVESTNGDYLPDNTFFVDPVIETNEVIIGASSLADSSSGDGTLATLTFEYIAIKESTLTLEKTVIVDSTGERLPHLHLHQGSSIVVGVPRLREDVNLDGVVDILDLTLIAASFGKASERCVSSYVYGDVNNDGVVDIEDLILMFAASYHIIGSQEDFLEALIRNAFDTCSIVIKVSADVNEDGIIDIVDLVLVAGALGNKAAAPSVYAKALRLFTAADVKLWLSQSQHLNLTDAQSQRGILFLQQLLAAFTPKKTALLPNYPNPFNPETWIPYQLAKDADVTLHIYTVNGILVRTLALGHKAAGMYQNRSHAAYWDGKNALGESVASGLYFYTLKAGDFSATRKMLIQK